MVSLLNGVKSSYALGIKLRNSNKESRQSLRNAKSRGDEDYSSLGTKYKTNNWVHWGSLI